MVFDGWWSKDGATDGDWGTEITSSTICHGEVVAYAKFKQPYTVKFNWSGATGPAIEAKPVKVAFLTDFYNWCLKQNAFAAADMSLDTFIGKDATTGEYTFKGQWVQYTGAGFDSAEFGLNLETMKNFFVAEWGKKPEVIAENNTHFINDAEMYAKWANLMQWLETNVDKNERQWTKINNYLLCGLGRWMVGVSTGAALKDTVPSGEGFDYASIGQVRTDTTEMTVFELSNANAFPYASVDGVKFNLWTDGTNYYDSLNVEELHGKTLTPAFTKIVEVEVTPETLEAKLAEAKPGYVYKLAAGTYTGNYVITVPFVSFEGPNADKAGFAEGRVAEAHLNGTLLVKAVNFTVKGIAMTDHAAKISETVGGAERSATVIILGSNFTFENNYVTSGKGIVFEAGTVSNFVMKYNFFDWTKENGATGAWAWRPIRLDEKVTNMDFCNNKVIQTADDDTSAGLYDIVYIQNAAGIINFNENDMVGYSYNWNFNIANASAAQVINFCKNKVYGVDGGGNTTLNVAYMGKNTSANYCDNEVKTAGTTYSFDITDSYVSSWTGTITVTGNKFYSDTYKPRIKDAVNASQVIHKDNVITAGAVTATGSFTFTMDGNSAQ
jgi:hypothetical protein